MPTMGPFSQVSPTGTWLTGCLYAGDRPPDGSGPQDGGGRLRCRGCVSLLGVSRSGVLQVWVQRGQAGPVERRRERSRVEVRRFHAVSGGVDGAPRVIAGLRADGEIVSVKTVVGIVRVEGIAGISPRR